MAFSKIQVKGQIRLETGLHIGTSNAFAAMRAGAEVKHALLGAGIESSHSYERTHIDSIGATQSLVDAYLLSDLIEE